MIPVAAVQEVLDEIRPYLQRDGGDVELLEVTTDGVVRVVMTGACGGCPMSMLTLRMGIEQILRERIPEISAVEAEGLSIDEEGWPGAP